MSILSRLAVVLSFVLLDSPLSRAETVQLVPVADNSMYEENPTHSNGIGPQIFAGRIDAGFVRRALVKFDFSAIPSSAQITDVSLRMTVWRGWFSSQVALHRVLADWGEAGSNAGEPGGVGAPADSGDATWIHCFYPDTFWATPGGDYVGSASATQTVGASGSFEWTDPGLVSDVQAWVSGNRPNHGWIAVGDEVIDQSVKAFYSREASSSGSRPLLTVTYDVAVAVNEPFATRSWSQVKSFHR